VSEPQFVNFGAKLPCFKYSTALYSDIFIFILERSDYGPESGMIVDRSDDAADNGSGGVFL
jgi:hypothetical protein